MPNPFYLRGPEFLVFYVCLGLLVILSVMVWRRRPERPARVPAPLTDYLKIAYLRGGADEALRVAILALVDRELLAVVNDDRIQTSTPTVPAGLQRTEQRLLEACRKPTKARDVLDDESLKATATTECEAHLARAGLLPDERLKAARKGLVFTAWLVLGSVALAKTLVALSVGRTNIGFLVAACFVFSYIVYTVAHPARTAAGEAMLGDLRMLFDALRDRAMSIRMPSGGNEVALLAAVFGVGAVPAGHAYVKTILRKPQRDSSSGASCGSACGSSCGGGCGGGCGGCGS
jgi:uncharacterized protein (TIGR04222 family)